MSTPKRNEMFHWSTDGSDPLLVIVNRVAKDGSWADITVVPKVGSDWNKRMPLPFPASFQKL